MNDLARKIGFQATLFLAAFGSFLAVIGINALWNPDSGEAVPAPATLSAVAGGAKGQVELREDYEERERVLREKLSELEARLANVDSGRVPSAEEPAGEAAVTPAPGVPNGGRAEPQALDSSALGEVGDVGVGGAIPLPLSDQVDGGRRQGASDVLAAQQAAVPPYIGQPRGSGGGADTASAAPKILL